MGLKTFLLRMFLFASISSLAQFPLEIQKVSSSQYPPKGNYYEQLKVKGSVQEIREYCSTYREDLNDKKIKELVARLVEIGIASIDIESILVKAETLVLCKAPSQAQQVLSRISPKKGGRKSKWLLLSWQAYNAEIDHINAAKTLWRLSDGDLSSLDSKSITLGIVTNKTDKNPLFALDLLSEHESALGNYESAIKILLAGRSPGVIGERRFSKVNTMINKISRKRQKEILLDAYEKAFLDRTVWLARNILSLQSTLELITVEDRDSAKKDLDSL